MHQTDTACPSHPVSGPGPPLLAVPPHICLNVYMFKCLYVHTFWESCKYWILDIERQTPRCTKIRKTKNNLPSKINFPVTSTTGSKPSLTSYYRTQSLRHFGGGSINNISELDQFIIRAIDRGPFHSTVAKDVKISTFPTNIGTKPDLPANAFKTRHQTNSNSAWVWKFTCAVTRICLDISWIPHVGIQKQALR